MPMLRAGLAVAAVLIGAVAALLGIILIVSALRTGSLNLSYGSGSGAVSETITRAADAGRFWQYVLAIGVVPAILGAGAARWGWRAMSR